MALQLKPYLSYPSTRAALAVVTATRFTIARSDQLMTSTRCAKPLRVSFELSLKKIGTHCRSPDDFLRRQSQ